MITAQDGELPTVHDVDTIAEPIFGLKPAAFRAFLRRRGRGYIEVTPRNLRMTQTQVEELLAELQAKGQPAEQTPLDRDRQRALARRAGRSTTQTRSNTTTAGRSAPAA